jgi:protein-tyrosine kinase
MGKTFEALERAENEYGAKVLKDPLKPAQEETGRPPHDLTCRTATDCYEKLKINLLARHSERPIKTILFSGTTHGDGSSTTAINFAGTLAKNCHHKVLLMEANFRTPNLHNVFHLESTNGLSNLGNNGTKLEAVLNKVGPENFYVVTSGSHHAAPVSLFESTPFFEFLKAMREQFDYIILDGPPVLAFSESRVLWGQVDGVVMVLAAGKTRRPVAVRAKKEIEEAGGKVLGVVLNKRKFYIPDWIYSRL